MLMMAARYRRVMRIVCAGLLLAAAMAGCQAPAPKTPPAPAPAAPKAPAGGPLQVGITPNMPPLIYRQQNQIVGLEAEFARGLAAHLGRRLVFRELAWEDQIPALLEGRVDIIMSGMSITDLRRVRIAFCTPYAQTGQMALVRRSDVRRFQTGYYSLVEIPSIGAVRNTTGNVYVRSNFPDNRQQFFDTPDDAVRALLRRRIDILIHDAPFVMMAAAKFESQLTPMPTLFTSEYLAWGVRKDDLAMREAANGYIDELKRTGRLQEMVNRWIPFTQKK
jgi:polar amino acid transport system substrate-binding protein